MPPKIKKVFAWSGVSNEMPNKKREIEKCRVGSRMGAVGVPKQECRCRYKRESKFNKHILGYAFWFG